VNLPSRLKMTEPRYVGLAAEQIPSVRKDGATVNVIAGNFDGTRGGVSSATGITMMTIELDERAHISLPAPHDHNVFLYVVRGEIAVGGSRAAAMHLVEMNSDGDTVEIEGVRKSLVIFGHARPFGEPVVAHGPFVMNSREEIIQAIRDYQAGLFR